MHRLALALAAITTAALLVVAPTFAQQATVLGGAVFARTSDGSLWMIQDGKRLPLAIVPWDDERVLSLPVAEPETWVSVAKFQNVGDMNTPPFSVGRRWRIVYSMKARASGTIQLCITANGVTDSRDGPSFGCYRQPGESYAYEPGTFYMEIGGVNDGWTVDVQELL